MTPHDFAALLRPTLADRRFGSAERDALKRALSESRSDIAALRAKAFDLAAESATTTEAKELFGWLEEVVKLVQPVVATGPVQAEAHFSPHGDCVGRIVRLFAESRERIEACVFTITDDRITDAMLAAQRRGVAVRLITDNDKAFDKGSDIERLAEDGILVRVDRTPFHMHHKFAIFDGRRLLNGSYNWTRGAARDNLENIVVLSDASLIAAFAAEFDRLWRELA